ncbi:hypothetical protein H8D83_00835 [Candidatus Woesearchaeota archaeon]|nr:hypothetical protein [Candidatus Woesearchaeota archaeon]MBL7050575.1 hypothetical protein [Candidatus Woesearchaeota archaeon]
MSRKKAQTTGSGAATLITIITLIIILYILFLPPETREELLGDNTTSNDESQEAEEQKNILLSENIGTLTYFPSTTELHNIGNIYLFETTNAEVLDAINPFIIRKGWFDEKFKTLNFKINELENTENVILSIAATKTKGILYIYLNNELIYEGEFESLTPGPITFKKTLLKEDNTLRFELDGVGLAFWKTNEYQFKNMQIIGDVTDISGQEGQNVFTLTNTEYLNLEESVLKFVPYCSDISQVGKLTIQINNRNIFSAIPICDDSYQQSFSPAILNSGQNKIKFTTSKGSYSIEQIKVVDYLKETKSALYYFEVNESQYEEVTNNEKDVLLTLSFVENDENKKATINVNGHLTEIDQTEEEFSKNINSWIEQGNNYVEIKPKTTLNIVGLMVKLE